MENALNQLEASALLVTGSEHGFILNSTNAAAGGDLANEASDFLRLSKLAVGLKMGPIKQAVIVGDKVVVCTKRSESLTVVSAPSIDRAVLADSILESVDSPVDNLYD